MKKIIIFSAFLILIISCEKYDNTCKCTDPLTELTWLRYLKSSMTNCFCETSIIQATYLKQTVFYVANTDDLCDGFFTASLMDCSGALVKTYTDFNAFASEVTDIKVLYRCKSTR